jgi:hypothetical protein
MRVLNANVRGERLLLDEPTGLPESSGVTRALVDDEEIDEAERTRLDAALERSMEQARAGRLIAEAVIGKLFARRCRSSSRFTHI